MEKMKTCELVVQHRCEDEGAAAGRAESRYEFRSTGSGGTVGFLAHHMYTSDLKQVSCYVQKWNRP